MIPPLGGAQEGGHRRAELTRAEQKRHAAQRNLQALTLELAHHQRLRFGPKSAALAVPQGDLGAATARLDHAASAAGSEPLAHRMPPARPRRASPDPRPRPAKAGGAVRTGSTAAKT